MATRGTAAKQHVIEKIKAAFGADYIGEVDKKIYVWSDDDGERVQIALALTCPKTMIETVNTSRLSYNEGIDFEANDTIVVPAATAEITQDERDKVRELMKRLNL